MKKVGDKFICIKSVDALLTLNKVYYIREIGGDNVGVKYWIDCDNFKSRFVFDFKFNQYFMTLSEYRSAKLKKLNESR